ncbi:MAG: adenylate/guanylate cyclase domain-containing protein [Verrucomicrobiota bacterium]
MAKTTGGEGGGEGTGIRRLLASPLYAVVAPLVMAVVIWGGSYVPFLERVENVTVDGRFRMRAERDVPVDERVLMVGITEADLVKFGRWPWDRAVHGDLLTLLAHKKPAAVAYDVLFTEQEGLEDNQNDEYMGEAALGLGVAVIGAHAAPAPTEEELRKEAEIRKTTKIKYERNRTEFGRTKPITDVRGDVAKVSGNESALLPLPVLAEGAHIGFVDAQPSVDGVFREQHLVVRVGEEVYPSLATAALMQYWGLGPDEVTVDLGNELVFRTEGGDVSVPMDERGMCLINWRNEERFLDARGRTSFDYAMFAQPLGQLLLQGKPWPEDLPEPDGKIVLIGIAQPEGLIDLGASPYNPQSPKVLTHANVINNILQGDFLRPVNFWLALGVWVVVSMATLLFLRQSSIALTIGVPFVLLVVYVAAAFLLFERESLVLPLAWPVLGFAALHGGAITARWMQEAGQREVIKSMFSSYIGPDIMEHLLTRPDLVNLRGERKGVTIFFSDIRSFTTISEGMESEELVAQLNEYFEKMVACVNDHQGTTHKYIGDAIMAVWGDVNVRGVYAQSSEETAQNAVRATLAMVRELGELQERWEAEGKPVFKIGCGLNYGEVVVGDIGAQQRREFTVIGDAVNTASRLEGFTKKFGVEIVVSESVNDLLGGGFLTRSLALVAPKGKTQAVRLYEVMGELDGAEGEVPSSETQDWVRRHEEGFEKFLSGDYAGARELFEKCAAERPGNLVCERYLEVSRAFEVESPGEGYSAAEVFAEEAKSK